MDHMDLNEVINGIDDITDPSSIEKIFMYLDYIQIQNEEFLELLIDKLGNMNITWEQPWYQQQKSLTRPLAVNDQVEEMFRTDTISKDESEKIHKNWKKLRQQFDLPNTLQCFARWRNKSKCRSPYIAEERVRRFVTAFLARGLQRTLNQVYKHILRYYGNPVKGHYSMQEEKLMEVCFYHNPRNAVPILSTILGREPRGIYKKLQENIIGKEDRKRLIWKLPLAAKFLKLLLEYTEVPLEDLKYRKIDKPVWLRLEKDMNQQYIYLQKFWCNQLHVQLFVKKSIKISKIRKKIVRELRKSSCKVWSDIRWKELVKKFPDGFTHSFLYRVWAEVFRNHKEILKTSMPELLEYAVQKIPQLPQRRLRTLKFTDEGELEEIKYD